MKSSSWKIILLLILWACSASAGIVYLGVNQFKEFDPQLKLSSAMMDIEFEQHFVRLLDISGQENNAIIHITDSQCFCSALAKAHKNSLNRWAIEHDFNFRTVEINEHTELLSFVPAVPSVVVIGKTGDLVYFGPYSQGAGCLQTTGMIDERLAHLVKLQSANTFNSGAYIQSEAKGCYCHV